ncbi:MAG TPA: preprotein translocase subunit YajC [bacterium]|nr:preprotein translocase subunit YajC [bacterium]
MDSAYAQTATTAVPPAAAPMADSPLGGLLSLAPMLLILGAFYLIFMLPQSKERKKREAMLKNIQRGDRILTRGGHFATVADVKDQVVSVKLNEITKVDLHRDYIDSVEKPV